MLKGASNTTQVGNQSLNSPIFSSQSPCAKLKSRQLGWSHLISPHIQSALSQIICKFDLSVHTVTSFRGSAPLTGCVATNSFLICLHSCLLLGLWQGSSDYPETRNDREVTGSVDSSTKEIKLLCRWDLRLSFWFPRLPLVCSQIQPVSAVCAMWFLDSLLLFSSEKWDLLCVSAYPGTLSFYRTRCILSH